METSSREKRTVQGLGSLLAFINKPDVEVFVRLGDEVYSVTGYSERLAGGATREAGRFFIHAGTQIPEVL